MTHQTVEILVLLFCTLSVLNVHINSYNYCYTDYIILYFTFTLNVILQTFFVVTWLLLFVKGKNKFIKEFMQSFIYCWTLDNRYSFNIKYTETFTVSFLSQVTCKNV